jgi:hypothetical protein
VHTAFCWRTTGRDDVVVSCPVNGGQDFIFSLCIPVANTLIDRMGLLGAKASCANNLFNLSI